MQCVSRRLQSSFGDVVFVTGALRWVAAWKVTKPPSPKGQQPATLFADLQGAFAERSPGLFVLSPFRILWIATAVGCQSTHARLLPSRRCAELESQSFETSLGTYELRQSNERFLCFQTMAHQLQMELTARTTGKATNSSPRVSKRPSEHTSSSRGTKRSLHCMVLESQSFQQSPRNIQAESTAPMELCNSSPLQLKNRKNHVHGVVVFRGGPEAHPNRTRQPTWKRSLVRSPDQSSNGRRFDHAPELDHPFTTRR